MRKFPLFVDISNKKVVVVGGGVVATRRVNTLKNFGPKITVISPEVDPVLANAIAEEGYQWIREAYDGKAIANDCHTSEASCLDEADCVKEASCLDEADCEKEASRLDGADMVLACTDDDHVNSQIAEACRNMGILVNSASCKAECDFHFPGIILEEDITIGLNGSGENHKKVREIREKVQAYLCK